MVPAAVVSRYETRARSICAILFASLFLSLFVWLKIPLFFTPVPLVLQNSIAVALGVFLGAKRGAASVLLFLIYGVCGLPVFAGGVCGLSILSKLSSLGYLLGYVFAAFVAGKMVERFPTRGYAAFLAGHLVILVCGAAFFALAVGMKQAFYLGFVPFILIDLVKAGCCGALFHHFSKSSIG